MDYHKLQEIYREWSDWYDKELSNKEISIPIKGHKENVEYLFVNSFIERYCGYEGEKINQYLRNGEYKDSYGERNLEFALYASILSILIQTTPKIPESFIAYRYVSQNELRAILVSYPYAYPNNAPYHKHDFLSVTLNKNLHNECSEKYTSTNYMLELTIPTGIHAICPMFIKRCGRNIEQELILPKDSYIIYKGKHRKENGKKIYSCSIMY